MRLLYFIGLKLYFAGIFLASFFNEKAKKWITGRKDIFKNIAGKVGAGEKIIWFHAASLGEFEQGRPVIEAIKKDYKEYRILLTFFSPSGYEIRKNYAGADFIFYLPFDSSKNSKKFIDLVKPEKVFFIKYEFWYYYLKNLSSKKIPVYLISSIFRKNQIFFRWYGKWFRKMLNYFDHIFVQEEKSLDLLRSININNSSVAGDTRFDRVAEIARQTKPIEIAEKFRNGQNTVICGSTWEKDEELLIEFINTANSSFKFIIAPHEIDEAHIAHITSNLKKTYVRYSKVEMNSLSAVQVLIIDNIGMLSSLYRYGDIAYIGGGFGVGIHNILEPATFGLPVVFGPNYKKFREAADLISLKGALSISSYSELKEAFDNLMVKENRGKAGEVSKNYVLSNCGATKSIMDFIFFHKE